MTPPVLTDHFSTLAGNYDAILSDVWGVIHNGVESFPAASEALTRPASSAIQVRGSLASAGLDSSTPAVMSNFSGWMSGCMKRLNKTRPSAPA